MAKAKTKAAASSSPLDENVVAHEIAPEREGDEGRDHETVSTVAILLVGIMLRFYDLALKPLHHDEGVNGFFLRRLIDDGVYKYDPANYHGPTLYYFSLLSSWVLGLNTFAVRSVVALFGVGILALLLSFRRDLGVIPTLCAIALLAVSPGMVFQSRYFIHETLLVFFTVALVICAWRYLQTERAGWILGAFASAGMMFATKETAFISWGVLVLAALSTRFYVRLRKVSDPTSDERNRGTWRRRLLHALAGLALFVLINVILYSSFFTYAEGIKAAISTFAIWARTGEQHHVHSWWTYLQWLSKLELPLLVLGAAGALLAFWKPRSGLVVFTAFWAVGMIAAYSLIPYKTPWLMLNFLPPLAILAGCAVHQIGARLRPGVAVVLFVAVALGFSSYQSIRLNFYRYDDESMPYVYAPTAREFLQMISKVREISATIGAREDTPIAVVYSDYWPMPWYLPDYTRVSYHGQMAPTTDPIVIGSDAQEPLLKQQLGDYVRLGSWKQRNGLQPVVYVRRELAGVLGVP